MKLGPGKVEMHAGNSDWGLIKCRRGQCAIPEGSDLSPSREDLELTN